MPTMSGQELVSAVRQDTALAGIRIIGMSGEMEDPDIARELRLADYLVKPIDVSRLVAAVRQAIATPGGDGVEAGL
jgi:CheY-like chemotaxis protein